MVFLLIGWMATAVLQKDCWKPLGSTWLTPEMPKEGEAAEWKVLYQVFRNTFVQFRKKKKPGTFILCKRWPMWSNCGYQIVVIVGVSCFLFCITVRLPYSTKQLGATVVVIWCDFGYKQKKICIDAGMGCGVKCYIVYKWANIFPHSRLGDLGGISKTDL